jgi:nitrite reductase/ring-hydroxylating ferredoxin subunit
MTIGTGASPACRGWQQVAFTRELEADLTPADVGGLPLVLVRRGGTVTAYDAVCPHRGANLAYGGRLDRDVIVCPFHGRRIGLGADCGKRYRVRAYRTLELGGCVFVLMSDEHENGFTEFLERLVPTHVFAPGFTLQAPIDPEYVIENAFDTDHFTTVHGISRRPRMKVSPGPHGELSVEALFTAAGRRAWHARPGRDGGGGAAEPVDFRFFGSVFCPNIVATELGEAGSSHVVITAATAAGERSCVIRVTVAVRLGPNGEEPPDEVILALLRDSRLAFEQDMEIWAHLVPDAPTRPAASDRPVLEYRRYCDSFRDGRGSHDAADA